jgi:hypothetical protein
MARGETFALKEGGKSIVSFEEIPEHPVKQKMREIQGMLMIRDGSLVTLSDVMRNSIDAFHEQLSEENDNELRKALQQL